MHLAARNGVYAEVAMLLEDERLVDPDVADSCGNSAFLLSAANGHMAVLWRLLDDGRVDPDRPNAVGNSALICAANKGEEQTVAALLGLERVDPNRVGCTHGIVGNSALLLACLEGHLPVVRLLLADERVDPNQANARGNTALILAAFTRRGAVVDELMRLPSVQPNARNVVGSTALILAAEHGVLPIVARLLKAGYLSFDGGGGGGDHSPPPRQPRVNRNVGIADSGYTALFAACDNSMGAVAEMLLEDGATARVRPSGDDEADVEEAQATFDAALHAVKRRRNNRFKGLTRAMVAFRRLRLRAAQAVYTPGGAGFAAAAASFNERAAGVSGGNRGVDGVSAALSAASLEGLPDTADAAGAGMDSEDS